ncbi:MAG: ABC transporter substrate-binding protein, partial [Dehalococcoidia bacterium]
LLISLAVALAVSAGLMGCTQPEKPEGVYKIGIVQFGTHPALDSCLAGFLAKMTELSGSAEIDYIQKNAGFDFSVAATIAQYFVSEDVDLIFSIATPTTQACADAVKGTDIPVIFAAVTDPVAAGFAESWERPGGQITGASDWADVEAQVRLGMDIYQADRLGVIYNAGEVNSVVQINVLKEAKSRLGITEIVEATAATTADVYAAAESLVGRVDAIWVPSDNTVAGAIASVVTVCEENHIPLFSSDVGMARQGAISGAGLDYYVNGQTAAELAIRVLVEGENPGDIPIAMTPMTIIYLCPAAAERMGVTIPAEVLARATEVCGE